MSFVATSINPALKIVDQTRSVVLASGGSKQVKSIMQEHQIVSYDHLPTSRHYTFPNVPSNLFSGVRYQATVTKGALSTLGHCTMKITVAVSGGAAVLAPVPLWFQRCDIRTATNNETVATMYDDTQMFGLLAALKKGQTKALFKNINIDASEQGYLGTTNPLQPGTYTFYLPLLTFLAQYELYWQRAKSDLVFDLQPANTIVASGTGTVSCTGLQLICEASALSPNDIAAYERLEDMYVKENIFLDPVLVPFTSQQLTAATTTLLDLTPLKGKCAFLSIYVRSANPSTVGNTMMKCLNIGDNEGASFDIVDATNQSLFGMGSSVESALLRNEHSVHHFDSDFLSHKAMYVIPFCDSIPKSYAGQINGFQQFKGDKLQLAITLPSAPVSEVQTITSTAAPSAGYYRLGFRGELSAELAFNASAAAMAAAFASMKQAARFNYTVVFSGALSSGASVTATFSTPETAGCNGDLLSIVGNGLNASGVATSSTVALTNAGTSGLASGVFDVKVYGHIFKRASYFNGSLMSRLV